MLPIIGAIAMGAGAIAGAAGSIKQGEEAERVARHNAWIARLAAADARHRGSEAAGQARMQGTQVASHQTAILGASGVDPGTGTAARLASASLASAEVNAQRIRNNAARQAWGLEQQATEMIRQGEAAQTASQWAAAGQILGGAGQIAGLGYGQGWFGGANA